MGSWYFHLLAMVLSVNQRSQISEQKEGQDEEVYDLKLNDCFVVFKFSAVVRVLGGYHSWVFVNGSFDHSGGFLSSLDQSLDVLHGLRGKVLFPSLLAHTSWDMFNNVESSAEFQGVCNLCFNHCFLHFFLLIACAS
jgi:hypothetical protein